MNADPKGTHAVYERQATEYDRRRSKALFEARWFMAEGFDVTGVDFSKAMLAIARDRWPDGD
ncbi:hypothetical protein [Ruegeria lacuscaerulensis]|uniref:hypothetical protein n=1 Tax=Ruegeria lacuscaerulensis TaxID=55218 RepID=UPI0014819328|nr:hypothetical protein [Ruegeria lacuscaerulensis]